MSEEQQATPEVEPVPEAKPPAPEKRDARPPRSEGRPGGDGKQGGEGKPQTGRGAQRSDRPPGDRSHGDRPRGDRPQGGAGRPQGGAGRPQGDRPRFDGPPDIELEKLISDSLYLDNAAHGIVAGLRDMDSGTRSQLRRLYSAVRRACRAADGERQHEFVMLRARLAYTIARHGLRRLDSLERLLLAVTRKNDIRGYERFRDLFEAIVAYNE